MRGPALFALVLRTFGTVNTGIRCEDHPADQPDGHTNECQDDGGRVHVDRGDLRPGGELCPLGGAGGVVSTEDRQGPLRVRGSTHEDLEDKPAASSRYDRREPADDAAACPAEDEPGNRGGSKHNGGGNELGGPRCAMDGDGFRPGFIIVGGYGQPCQTGRYPEHHRTAR